MLSELRFATRGLVRWGGGLAVALLTLAVGIGTATSLYAIVRLMLADFPGVPELDRVGRVYASSRKLGVERAPVALNEFDSTLSRATSFSAIGGYAESNATIGTGGDQRGAIAGYASPAFFRVMGVTPAAGRVFSDADLESAQPLVILSDASWRRHVPGGRLPGASVSVNGVDRAVVGVMPAAFSYGLAGIGADLWLPMGKASRETPPIVQVFARLRPGIGWPGAAGELGSMRTQTGPWNFHPIPLVDDARARAAGAYGFTLGPAVIILLLACVNVACMLLARGVAREQELSVRRALGASRGRVVRLLLAEHLLLALAGGALGCGVAVVLLRVMASAFATVLPALGARIAIDATLLPIVLAASVAASLVFGVLPALRLSRRDVAASLNGVPATQRVDIAGYGARDLAVFIEIGSAVGLIVFAAMLFNLFRAFQSVKPTFPADHIVAMRVPAQGLDAVAGRVAALPGVEGVTVSSGMLGARGGSGAVRIQTEGGQTVAMSRVPVGAAFLETLGLPLVRGRFFGAAELRGRAPVVVLSESAAQALVPSGGVLGMRIRLEGHETSTALVIGVCRDAIDYGPLSRAGLIPPTVFVPYEPSPQDPVVLARVPADAHRALRAIAAAAETPAGRPLPEPGVLGDEVAFNDRGDGLVVARMLGGFALIALLLAGTGIYSVVSQSVAQRTREFGIRMAIGGTSHGVLALVLARETKLIAAALATGAVFTFALTRAMFVELAILSTTAPSVWFALVGVCGGVAALAVLLATWRITRLEPAVVLRRF